MAFEKENNLSRSQFDKALFNTIANGRNDVVESLARMRWWLSGMQNDVLYASMDCCPQSTVIKLLEGATALFEEYTALHWAAFFGLSDVVRKLLEMDLDVNAKGFEAETPLHTVALGLALERENLWENKKLRLNMSS